MVFLSTSCSMLFWIGIWRSIELYQRNLMSLVFIIVNKQQVQAVLLLLGGGDVPPSTPTVEVPYAQIDKVMKLVKFLLLELPHIFSVRLLTRYFLYPPGHS